MHTKEKMYFCILFCWIITSSCNPVKIDTPYIVEAKSQFIVNNSIALSKASAPQPVWISLWPESTEPLSASSDLLARKYLEAGTHRNVKISIEDTAVILENNLTSFQVIMHHDTQNTNFFDYPSDPTLDKPVEINKKNISVSFTGLYIDSNADSYIEVEDQEMERNSVNILQVYANEPSVIVLHPDQGNLPQPPIIFGVTKLDQGTTNNVKINIFPEENVDCGDQLWAMLHVRSVSDDQPFDIDLPVITEPFIVSCND